MKLELNGFTFELELRAARYGQWLNLPLVLNDSGYEAGVDGLRAQLRLEPAGGQVGFTLGFTSPFGTRLRLWLMLLNQEKIFHLIPGNIHGDNNAAHVQPGEFPCLAHAKHGERNCAPLWEFRADRAPVPASLLCMPGGAVGISVDPYSASADADESFIRNGVFAALPNACGISVGYGNDPLTFSDKRRFLPATENLAHAATAAGTIFAVPGAGREAAHKIVRELYTALHERPVFEKTYSQGLRALADAFATVNWSPELQQYTNRRSYLPTDASFKPWRAVVEIGWTGGSMLAYPFALAERIFPDLRLPKTSGAIFDEICGGMNPASGFINDAALNRSTKNRPEGWNASEINGWWSGFLPQTTDNHCAYTNAQAAYYLLRAAEITPHPVWVRTALQVLDTAVELQREDGAFGYIFSGREKKVVDWEGFAGCWFAAALPIAAKVTGLEKYRRSAERAMAYYAPFVRDLACWGSPMDTFKSIDSEGNLAFLRAARHLHELTGDAAYLEQLKAGAHYEYLWRYAFRTRPQCPPLQGSHWNSCGGSITSVSNPHIHPMSVVATEDLLYLAKQTNDAYHRDRAEDGLAWLMNTMELYPDVMGYGRYGVLSERTCPSDGLLLERYQDTGSPASTWWSYNAWAAGSAMEALALRVMGEKSVF